MVAKVTPVDVTLPWFAWVAIGSAMASAVVWLAKTWKKSVESTHAETTHLAREVTAALVQNNEVIREHAQVLRELAALIREDEA